MNSKFPTKVLLEEELQREKENNKKLKKKNLQVGLNKFKKMKKKLKTQRKIKNLLIQFNWESLLMKTSKFFWKRYAAFVKESFVLKFVKVYAKEIFIAYATNDTNKKTVQCP